MMPAAAVQVTDLARRIERRRSTPIALFTGLDLDFELHRSTAIVGPSGCGKTSLLEVVGLLRQPDEGEVRHFGELIDFGDRVDLDLRRAVDIGYVFQSPHLFEIQDVADSIRDGLRYVPGLPAGDIDDRVSEIAGRVGIGDLLGQKVASLSGGERQRVSFARAIVKRPRLLLCDEPTASLDPAAAVSLLDLIFHEVQEGKMSALVVTHDDSVASRCDAVLDFRELVRS